VSTWRAYFPRGLRERIDSNSQPIEVFIGVLEAENTPDTCSYVEALRWYLQVVIAGRSQRWWKHFGGNTNYERLIKTVVAKQLPVCFVTFNYPARAQTFSDFVESDELLTL
jgi:hypothetical protein